MPSALAAPVKAVRDGVHVFLNDGVYGSLFEMPMIGVIDRTVVLTPEGVMREGAKRDLHRVRSDLRFDRPAAGRVAARRRTSPRAIM